MSERQYRYVECNGCFKEQRLDDGPMSPIKPDGWAEVWVNGTLAWDLCPGCHKEVAAMLFAKERINRIFDRPPTPAKGSASDE